MTQVNQNDLLAMIAKLQQENEAIKAKAAADLAAAKAANVRKLSLKVSEKGAVSLYGMGRFPVTLYAGQWDRVLGAADEIRAFMEANKASLAVKE